MIDAEENYVKTGFNRLLDKYVVDLKNTGDLNEPKILNDGLREISKFLAANKEFALTDNNYMKFHCLLILLHPSAFSAYYEFLDILIQLAEETKNADNLTTIYLALELKFAPINKTLIEVGIGKLLRMKSYANAAKLCSYIAEYPM